MLAERLHALMDEVHNEADPPGEREDSEGPGDMQIPGKMTFVQKIKVLPTMFYPVFFFIIFVLTTICILYNIFFGSDTKTNNLV